MEKSGIVTFLAVKFILGLLRLYRLIVSPTLVAVFGPMFGCRHLPTCSCYASEAINRFGIWRGGWLSFMRICRCQPWGTSGYDPVPDLQLTKK